MFNLNDASDKLQTTYQKPGIANITITGVVLEETNLNKVPYIRLTTKSDAGDQGTSGRMFLSTDKKPDKKTTGWAITARNLVDIISASHNVSDDEAKAMIKAGNPTELVTKLSATLVGRKLRAKFKGETGSTGAVYATLDRVESLNVPQESTSLRFDATRDIKPYTGPTVTEVSTESAADLPF